MMPDVFDLQPDDARKLCRFCLRAPRPSEMRQLSGTDKIWPNSELGQMFAKMTGEELISYDVEPLISDRWCVDCALLLCEIAQSVDSFRKSNAFWESYVSAWRTDEVDIKMEVIEEVPMEQVVVHNSSQPANTLDKLPDPNGSDMSAEGAISLAVVNNDIRPANQHVDPIVDQLNSIQRELALVRSKYNLRRQTSNCNEDGVEESVQRDRRNLKKLQTPHQSQSSQAELLRGLHSKVDSIIQIIKSQQQKIDMLFELVSTRAFVNPSRSQQPTIKENAQIVLPTLPLNTPEQIDSLDSKLLLDKEFCDQMMIRLKRSDRPSPSLNQKVRFLMEALFSYQVTKQYTWTGKSHSHTVSPARLPFFDKYGFIALLLNCLQYRSSWTVTEKEVLKAMQQYFKRIRERYAE